MSEPQSHHLRCPVLVLRINETQVKGDSLADALRDELLAAYLQSNAHHVVVDFQKVTYMSSAGFRPLLSLVRQVRSRQGRLVLCGLSPEVHEVFTVTRLIGTAGSAPATFDVEADVPAAVAWLDREHPVP